MRKTLRFLFCLLTSVVLSGCVINGSDPKLDSGSTYIKIDVEDAMARTALPDIDWTDYTYSLDAIEGYGSSDEAAETNLFSGRNFSGLSKEIVLTPKNYMFTLTAYTGATPVLSGAAEADLSTGSKSVTFRMYAVTGSKGNAEITIKMPDDGAIATVKAVCSQNPIAEITDFAASSVKTLSIKNGVDSRTAVYSLTNLNSATAQYALFFMYDDHGGLINSFPESMYIVGGKTSASTINITSKDYQRYAVAITLKKNNQKWLYSDKKLSLVGKENGITYNLKELTGVFSASVAEGTYYIYADSVNTGIEFNSVNKTMDLEYFTVELNPGDGFELVPVYGAEEFYGKYYILKGKDFVYKAVLKNGFKTPSSFEVKLGTETVSLAYNKELTISSVDSSITLSTTSTEAIVYTIRYEIGDAVWLNDYVPVTSYTVLTDVDLPTSINLRGNGKILDGWKLKQTDKTGIAYIKAGALYENLVLYPIWKDSAYVDTNTKTIYANGISLLIKENAGATNVYLDLNSNGIIDSAEEIQVVALNGETDFTNYHLRAGNKNNTPIASDFTFTMTGGRIASITGMGAEADNRSVLNISGTSRIGSYIEDKDVDEEGNEIVSYTNVTGVDLSSIYNEWVIINGQMEGDYQVILVSQYDYDPNVPHYVGYIGDSVWANFKKFKCFKKIGTNSYNEKLLAMKDVTENGQKKTIIRIASDEQIALPGLSGDDVILGTVTEGFSLGDSRITAECSVFSVSVKNGTFTLNQTELEGATEILVQPTETTYETSLTKDKPYVYLHILSSKNEITPENASEFLSKMTFRRTKPDVPMELKVNLETVPFSQIQAMVEEVTANLGNVNGFSYFDGSFYLGVRNKDSNGSAKAITWYDAYNNAKAKTFNGLEGYLINITSQVENNYIVKRMNLGQAWTGGGRFTDNNQTDSTDPESPHYCKGSEIYQVEYDSKTRARPTNVTYVTEFRWQAGPEAGMIFTNGTIPDGEAGNKKYSNKVTPEGAYSNWQSGEPNDTASGVSEQVLHLYSAGDWNDYKFDNSNVKDFIVEFTPYSTQYGTQKATYQSITKTAIY